MAGKGGGAWKVAYADFVTAMMAFFLVMWIVAQSKAVKEAVGGYFRDPYGTSDKTQGTGILPGTDTVVASPQPPAVNVKGGPLPVRYKNPRTAVKGRAPDDANNTKPGSSRRPRIGYNPQDGAIGGVIHFSVADTKLDAAEIKALKSLALRYAGKPNKIEVRGHAARSGDQVDVWQVSYARCRAVMDLLIECGIEADRIRLSQAGANEPVATAAQADWRSKNSRVEVYSLNEYSEERIEEDSHASGHSEHSTEHDAHADSAESHETAEESHSEQATSDHSETQEAHADDHAGEPHDEPAK